MNSILINSDKVKIIEPKKPIRYMFLMVLSISGCLAFFSLLEYIASGESIIPMIISTIIFVFAVIKEIFFVTYQKKIYFQEITDIKIRPILFGNGTVFLTFKLGNKTREVLLDHKKAKKIMKGLIPVIPNLA